MRPLASALVLLLAVTGVEAREEAFTLQILHTNDHHSHLDGSAQDLVIGGETVRVEMGGFSRLAALIDDLRDERTLVLNSGELNGTLYFSLFRGEPDFKLFNALGLDAYQIGNHEFDEGEEVLRTLLDMAEFPVLGANIHPTQASPLHGADILPYVVKEIESEKVAVIGVLKVEKTVESSLVTDAVEFSDEVETVRQTIAELEGQGIDKIIVLSHLGYDMDQELAGEVPGIDVIVGGDTHELLDSTGEIATMGIEADGAYPTVVDGPAGNPVYIVQAWEMAHGLGVLNLGFDGEGNVTRAQGNILLPVDRPFQRLNEAEEFEDLDAGQEAALLAAIEEADTLVLQEPDPVVAELLAPYTQELEAFRGETIGEVEVTMPFERIPAAFAAGETPTGSYAAHVVADAFLAYLPYADIAIQNSGGVRTEFLSGPFTVADAYTMLPFSNTLATLTMTGADVVAVLEDAADYALNSGSTGAFPYASHLRFDVAKGADKGSRIRNVEVRDRESGEWAPIDPAATYRVATNSFTALGKDGYDTFAAVIAADPAALEDSSVAYAVPLVEYFRSHLSDGQLPALSAEDYSLKSVTE
jgi:5''-nucleotidase/2'',3''-cyclic phosphodiesterase and related esterases